MAAAVSKTGRGSRNWGSAPMITPQGIGTGGRKSSRLVPAGAQGGSVFASACTCLPMWLGE
eukprot:853659-Rhodomonas_salina.1